MLATIRHAIRGVCPQYGVLEYWGTGLEQKRNIPFSVLHPYSITPTRHGSKKMPPVDHNEVKYNSVPVFDYVALLMMLAA